MPGGPVRAWWLGALCVPLSPAWAEDEKAGVHAVRADDEVVVYGDLFARWNNTRWFIATEVQLPGQMMLMADENLEVRASAYQIRAILACAKDAGLGERRHEVSCRLEDVGIQVVTVERNGKGVQEILDEMDQKLTGAAVQLQVRDNGRVTNIDLEGTPEPRNDRERTIRETLRLLLARLVVGYDMKLRKSNFLSTGQWVETRSALLSMPSATATPSAGLIVHQLNGYQGHIVVQTKGEGQILDDLGISYKVEINGVSIYDEDQGFMTERVWSLIGRRTADSFDGAAFSLVDYHHAGVLRMLAPTEKADVGPTREVRVPGQDRKDIEELPMWEPVRPG